MTLFDAARPVPGAAHQEVGSIEGYLQGVGRDGYDRRIVSVTERITGETVRCVLSDTAVRQLEHREIREVWQYPRLEVHGRIHFASGGKIDRVDAEGFRSLGRKTTIPQINDIIDPDFTGGLSAEDYLERLRDGTLS